MDQSGSEPSAGTAECFPSVLADVIESTKIALDGSYSRTRRSGRNAPSRMRATPSNLTGSPP